MNDVAIGATVIEPAPPEVSRWRAVPWLLMALILLAQALYIRAFYAPALATPDDNGYWAQGSLIATQGRTWFRPESDVQYIGMHWLLTGDERYVSRYPPGLPMLIAGVYRLFGVEASVLVNPVLATLALLGIYLLSRRLLGPWWALLPCGVLAANPVFNQYVLWCFSHMAVTAFLLWGVLLMAWWTQRPRWWLALLAGLTLGCVPTIRYPEAVLALGVAVYLLWDVRAQRSTRWHIALAMLGAALPIAALAARNAALLGSFYKTGYALTNEQTGFGWSYFSAHFLPEFRSLNAEGVGPLFLLGVLGMLAMLATRERRRVGVLFVLLAVPVTLVYMAYYWGSGGGRPGGMGGGQGAQGLRFFLPTFPYYIIAGVWLLAEVLRGRTVAFKAALGIAVLAVQMTWGVFSPVDEFTRLHRTKEVLTDVTRKLETTVPHGDIVLGSRSFLDHLDFVRHWRLADLSLVQGERMGMGGGFRGRMGDANEDAPSPMQAAKRKQYTEKYGAMDPQERADALANELADWAHGRKVYFVGTQDELDGLRGALRAEDFKVVARVPTPPMPEGTEADLPPGPPGLGPAAGPGAGPAGGPQPPPGALQAPRANDDLPRGPGQRFAADQRFRMGGGRRYGMNRSRGFGGGPMGFGRSFDVKEILIAEWNGHVAGGRPPARAADI